LESSSPPRIPRQPRQRSPLPSQTWVRHSPTRLVE
jgi:hypothetical protein